MPDFRALAEHAIALDWKRWEGTPLSRRVYTCHRCGHQTLTVGGPLKKERRCAVILARGEECGGRLTFDWLTPGHDELDGPPRRALAACEEEIACEACGAEAGEHCETAAGATATPHVPRRKAWAEWETTNLLTATTTTP